MLLGPVMSQLRNETIYHLHVTVRIMKRSYEELSVWRVEEEKNAYRIFVMNFTENFHLENSQDEIIA